MRTAHMPLAVLFVFPVLALVPACAAYPDEEVDPGASRDSIYGGSVHTGHSAVGALAYAGGSFFCTGTLIAPRVVLTAAHCAMSGAVVFRTGTYSWTPVTEIAVTSWRVPTQWGGGNFSYDIALAVLANDSPVPPMAINRVAANVAPGANALFIGYGEDQYGNSGVKRAVSMTLEWRTTWAFEYGDSVHNTCYGDSGGPALVVDTAGVERVAGVTSHGDANCTVNGVDTRVDAHQTWIDAQIAALTPPAPAPGGGSSGSGGGSGSSLCTDARCGGQSASGCWCDDLCTGYGDCCANACNVCGEGC